MLGYNLCITKTYTELDAIKYKQSKGKIYCLNPAIERHLPKGAGQNLLDVGCGDGFYSTLANSKDYNYHGIDLSQGMIQKAKQLNPNVNFYTGSCFELDKHFSKGQFDVVISNMLFPEFSSVNEIKKTMEQISNVLKPSGLFILTTSHPAFNRYMRKYFLNDPAVETDFYSYFDSGKSYTVKSRSTG
ncbi:MAG: methyltransferase type 11, partial [uncultured bacterium]